MYTYITALGTSIKWLRFRYGNRYFTLYPNFCGFFLFFDNLSAWRSWRSARRTSAVGVFVVIFCLFFRENIVAKSILVQFIKCVLVDLQRVRVCWDGRFWTIFLVTLLHSLFPNVLYFYTFGREFSIHRFQKQKKRYHFWKRTKAHNKKPGEICIENKSLKSCQSNFPSISGIIFRKFISPPTPRSVHSWRRRFLRSFPFFTFARQFSFKRISSVVPIWNRWCNWRSSKKLVLGAC